MVTASKYNESIAAVYCVSESILVVATSVVPVIGRLVVAYGHNSMTVTTVKNQL